MRIRAVAVLGLVAACGDGLPPPDAVPPIDGPAGRVTVRFAGSEFPTVRVLFQNADSSLVLSTRTGADGTANAFMAPGGFVTVIDDRSSATSLYTWADVQPGDDLVFSGSLFSPVGELGIAIPLRIPLDPGQSIYEVFTACGSDQLTNPSGLSFVALHAGCAQRQDLLVVSRDFSFTTERYLYVADALLDGSEIDLPGPWRTFDTARVEVTGMPARTQFVNAQMTLLDEGSRIEQSDRGGGFELAGGAGEGQVEIPLPGGVGAFVQITPSFEPGLIGALRAMHWGPAQPTTRFDLSQRPLRTYHEFPTYLMNQHAIHWSEDGPGEPADAVMAEFGWRGPNFENRRTWTIVAPGNVEATVRYPRVPIADLMPASDSRIEQPYALTTIRLDGGGYARVKKSIPISWGSAFPWPIDAAEGTVLIQELGSPQFPND